MATTTKTNKQLNKMKKRKAMDIEEKQEENQLKVTRVRAQLDSNILDMQHVAERTQKRQVDADKRRTEIF